MSKYYYRYVNGNKWIQINGEGDDPKNCKISWDCSENNEDIDIIMMEKKVRSPIYGWVELNNSEVKNNIYIQVLRIGILIRDGYECKKYEVPKIEPLLPDPQIIIPEKEEEIKIIKLEINKSELSKAVNVGVESGKLGFAFIPQVYDNKKPEDKSVDDSSTWMKKVQKDLEKELKQFYGD